MDDFNIKGMFVVFCKVFRILDFVFLDFGWEVFRYIFVVFWIKEVEFYVSYDLS